VPEIVGPELGLSVDLERAVGEIDDPVFLEAGAGVDLGFEPAVQPRLESATSMTSCAVVGWAAM